MELCPEDMLMHAEEPDFEPQRQSSCAVMLVTHIEVTPVMQLSGL